MSEQAVGTVQPVPQSGARRARRPWWRSRAAFAGYLFILPYVLFFLVFRIIPAVMGMFLSLGDYGIAGTFTFVGTENFTRLFDDSLFWNSLKVTAYYTLLTIPLSVGVSLAMATLCDRTLRGMSIYRSIFFLPVVTSTVMSGIIWVWIFEVDGPLNWLLNLVGIPDVGWLQSEAMVIPALAIVSAWKGFGYNMLILLAGMLAIPNEYYEAAHVDGAGWRRRYWHVTLPLLKPALFFVLVLEIIGSFQVFDTIYVMTGGGPVRASYSLTYMIYDQGFGYFDFGYASAAGVVLLVITLITSLIQHRLMNKGKSA
ncbi:sugar ABC transporter permease [Micromonospora sp. NPDC052213]|uniref:carbohydrate ABC transporter permease n=1 Tax=Micromonospora sp. NPDC052213 TaxID=3155812 RepID=UPI003429A1F0